MILVEGEPIKSLEPRSDWRGAFIPLERPDKTATYLKPQVSKEDVAVYLKKHKSLTISQIATLFFLTGEQTWARQFVQRLLSEAKNNAFIGNRGSIKYDQRKFMTRAMYLHEILKVDPGLARKEEIEIITEWFELAMRKIFQTGWMDYLYAIPFRDSPEGPYLNQEIGAGAISALLKFVHLPTLVQQAKSFLKYKSSGFQKNYRNQDDSLKYQDIWIGNAFVHYLYYLNSSPDASEGLTLAVDWMKYQLPNDTRPFEYGQPGSFRPLDTLAIAAFYLRDEEARWLLDRHLAKIIGNNESPPKDMLSLWLWDDTVKVRSFATESILLRGPTGYGFRPGPLAEDKIVLRSRSRGDTQDSVFLVANLGNIGWHRYPATNTTIRISMKNEVIVEEHIVKKNHRWLPAGRSSHRDKKIDRVRLNGLQIQRSGLDAWMGHLTGVYSRWRQDPPRTAKVSYKYGRQQMVTATTTGWAGVNHKRTYWIRAPDQLAVVDEIISNGNSDRKKLTWHTQGFKALSEDLLIRDIGIGEKLSISMAADKAIAIETRENVGSYPSSYADFEPNHQTSIYLGRNEKITVGTLFSLYSAERNLPRVNIERMPGGDKKIYIDNGDYLMTSR